MADQHIDIERMIMQAHYKMQLEAETSSVKGGQLSDMEREQYQSQIKDLLQAVETLLKSNKAMGERVTQLEKVAEAYDDLKAKYEKLEGELAMRKRDKYGKGGEKPKGNTSPSNKGKTKDEDEEDYINNGSKNDVPPAEEPEEEPASPEPPVKKERDLSNRPDHYNKMHADVQVIHECDLDKLAEMGLEFLHYTRPVDQFDRISITRQDTYRYVWVRDKKTGKEFAFFVPKDEKRECVFVNESDYDTPSIVPHTSCTWRMLSDLGVNRYQYALSCGREMFRMFNGKMSVSKQTILNWLKEGAEFLKGGQCRIKRRLLKKGTSIYVDEEFINLIGILYKVELESILLHRTEAEVLEARKTESIPILNELDQKSALLLAKVKSKELKISSKLEHALNYMRNHWKELIAYINIGNVLIDNNCCERAVRPFTNLRKSFGGFSSELGGAVAAAWLTFVESCKLQKKAALDVFRGYFQRIAEGRRDYDLITEEVLC